MIPDLEADIRRLSREGALYERLPGRTVRCLACAHDCRIKEGRAGVCRVRFNEGGTLKVPWGYVGALQVDPIEKKPFFHVLPGEKTLSFGMLGCDYHCSFCQNWTISQSLRDSEAGASPREYSPRELVAAALAGGAKVVTSTYNEPLITAEWAGAIFEEARKEGLRCSFVSNGNATPEALGFLKPWVEFYKVDLKGFDDKIYRGTMGGALAPVLRTIEGLVSSGIWVEVVTLVIPGLNDSDEELKDISRFIAGVSRDIPWLVTAFHKDYKMTDPAPTQAAGLVRAAEIGQAEGLRFVYAGNLPGAVGEFENTFCPGCGAALVERRGYHIRENRIAGGRCPDCGEPVAGAWG